jgi:hypothetical protein
MSRVDVLRQLASGEAVKIRPANWKRKPNLNTRARHSVKVNIHYMIGNHDWYYHLPGEELRSDAPAMSSQPWA